MSDELWRCLDWRFTARIAGKRGGSGRRDWRPGPAHFKLGCGGWMWLRWNGGQLVAGSGRRTIGDGRGGCRRSKALYHIVIQGLFLLQQMEFIDAQIDTTLTGGTKYWIPQCDDAIRPHIGQRFKGLSEANDFYRIYASTVGFDVRQSTLVKSRDNTTVLWKYLVCSREGYRITQTQANWC
ncbi:FAR1-related protein [Striga asiatica]|uniref:FAR1-related protein n=1 Tax=Striga asiatica TaxID=4170 RepID=A0A5A7QPY7_STRAF|nr:FAR1-related protein [Striga asiatica]